jgi:hypothetical protein
VARRRHAPVSDKSVVDTADIPAWRYTFSVPDDFPLDDATPEELRAAYADWQQMCRDWDATHEVPSMQTLLDDPVAMQDVAWDPATDPP